MHDPIFLAGRYNKYSRTLSQTAWLIDGERKMISSIEEIIGDVLKKELGAKGYLFMFYFNRRKSEILKET